MFKAVLGVVLVVLFGTVDYATGPEVSFSIFYLIPIVAVTWLVGLVAGIVTSVVAAASYLAAILMEGRDFSHPSIPYWNAVVRLGFFLVVTASLASLRRAMHRHEEMQQFIVHDLRSPLTNVMTGLQIMGDEAEERLDARQRDFVEMCMVSCTRMLTLINSLLDLSLLERGSMPVHPESVRAEQLCETALNQVRLWAGQKGVHLEEIITEGTVVEADPELTVRVLVNLLSNAVRHAPPNSVVTTRVEDQSTGVVTFSVVDEGPGISEEWATRIFDAYVQADTDRSAVREGSGLGLAFSRRAIHAQGGKIWLRSEPNAGTTVIFSLPRALSAEGASEETHASSTAEAGL